MSLEISGKLLQILPEQSGTGKNGVWRKQEFVIEIGGDYPKKICMNVWGDKVQILNSLEIGSTIKAYFDVESREYQGKWYTDAKAWKLEASTGNTTNTTSKTTTTQTTPNLAQDPFPEDMMTQEIKDDLPF